MKSEVKQRGRESKFNINYMKNDYFFYFKMIINETIKFSKF